MVRPRDDSARSQEVLNVSQDAMTSPEQPNDTEGQAHNHTNDSFVEDSYKESLRNHHHPVPTQPLQRPRHEANELYDVTPEKVRNERAKAAKESQVNGAPAVQQPMQKTEAAEKRDSLASLLQNGAAVHGGKGVSDVANMAQRQAAGQGAQLQSNGKQSAAGSPAIYGASLGDGSASLTNSTAATRLQRQNNASASTSKAAHGGGVPSAAEALRLRRGGGSALPTPNTRSGALGMLGTNTKTDVVQRNDRVTPARSIHQAPQSSNKPVSGKLQRPSYPASGGKPVRTPLITSTQAKASRNAPAEPPRSSGRATNAKKISVPAKTSKKADKVPAAPARSQPRRDAKQDQTYDVPGSSEEDEHPCAKKARSSKLRSEKDQETHAPRRVDAEASKAAKDQTTVIRGNVIPQPNGGVATNDGKDVASQDPKQRKRSPAKVAQAKLHNEPLEEFEKQVVNYGDDGGEGGKEDATDSKALKERSNGNVRVSPRGAINQIQREPHLAAAKPRCNEAGTSQENAIVLSDRRSPSSTPDREPQIPQQVLDATGSTSKTGRPKTPAYFPSSPPRLPQEDSLPSAGSLVNPATAKKASIIGFDSHGPLNQGVPSARKRTIRSVRTDRFSDLPHASVFQPLGSRETPGKAARPSDPPSIVASGPTRKPQSVAPPPSAASNVQDALAGFVKKPAATQVSRPVAALAQPMESHQAKTNWAAVLPPAVDDDFMSIDDIKATTLVAPEPEVHHAAAKKMTDRPTASQQAMPPPTRDSHPQVQKVMQMTSTAAAPPAPARQDNISKPHDNVHSVVSRKRASEDVLPSQEVVKKPRHARDAALDTDVVRHAASQKPSIEIQQPAASAATRRAARESSRLESRKSGRQGSQTVDLMGSPVPLGLDIDDKTTALEVFSQQANVSDGTALAETIVRRQKASQNSAHQKPPPTGEDAYIPPPSAQPQCQQPLPSNKKPSPAPPKAPSRVMTCVAMTQAGRLLIEDEAEKSASDPFSRSQNAPQARINNSSHFVQQLKRHTVEPRRPAEPQPEKVRISEVTDADKTLVEPSPPVYKPTASYISVSTSDTSSPDSSNITDDNYLALWRTGLLPHQMNLFDELIVISHKLVAHLQDSETAAADFVEDYHRRGVRMVEQMEKSHAVQWQKYVAGLEERKGRLCKEFARLERKVGECMEVVKGLKEQRAGRMSGCVDVIGELEDVLEQYC